LPWKNLSLTLSSWYTEIEAQRNSGERDAAISQDAGIIKALSTDSAQTSKLLRKRNKSLTPWRGGRAFAEAKLWDFKGT
jgi:hypothetical protein